MTTSVKGQRKDQDSVALRANRSFTKEGETERQQTLREEHLRLPIDRGWAWVVLFGKSAVTST